MGNRHKGMDLRKIWFRNREFNQLINAVECNQKDEVFEILFDIKERGDLEE